MRSKSSQIKKVKCINWEIKAQKSQAFIFLFIHFAFWLPVLTLDFNLWLSNFHFSLFTFRCWLLTLDFHLWLMTNDLLFILNLPDNIQLIIGRKYKWENYSQHISFSWLKTYDLRLMIYDLWLETFGFWFLTYNHGF